MRMPAEPRGNRVGQCYPIVNLLKPQYRALLRFSRKRPHFFRVCSGLSLIACFAACVCAAAYMHKTVDEILTGSPSGKDALQHSPKNSKFSGKARLSVTVMKRILEQRGVMSDHAIEREEMDALLQQTGEVTYEEIQHAEKSITAFSNFRVDESPDTELYARISSNDRSNVLKRRNSVHGAESLVFDNEALFIERVDDNKDSVWLLSVIAVDSKYRPNQEIKPGTPPNTLITDEVWGRLVHRYTPFGFKMGLINCFRLQSLCQDRGLVAADLILALPKGGDRIKDSVQYRAFPKQFVPNSPFVITELILHQIHSWISGVLAERVRHAKLADEIVPGSVDWTESTEGTRVWKRRWISWLTERPKPIHVLWMRNRTKQFADPFMNSALAGRHPPLVLSALSVPFTGRVRFWLGEIAPPLHPSFNPTHNSETNHWPATTKSSDLTVQQLLKYLRCPPDSNYLILTPEATCLSFGKNAGEYLSYPTLELYLRLLYPSVDDVLLASFFILNLLILFNSSIRAGKLLAFVGRRWMGMPLAYTPEQLGLIQSIIRLARRGWTLHQPVRPRTHLSVASSSSSVLNPANRLTSDVESATSEDYCSTKRQIICWGKSSVIEFFSYNLLFLLIVLPVINALSSPQAAFVLNSSLWLLRAFVTSKPMATLRLSITNGHFTGARLIGVVAFYYCFILLLAAHIYFVLLDVKPFSRLRRRTVSFFSNRRLTSASPDALLTELTRSLLTSDYRIRVEQTSSELSGSSSSTSPSEIDPNETVPQDISESSITPHSSRSSLTSARTVEQERLLRRLGRLHELLYEGSHYLPTSAVPPLDAVVDLPEHGDIQNNQRAAPAHIYTWQCSRQTPHLQPKDESMSNSDAVLCKSPQLLRSSCEDVTVPHAQPFSFQMVDAEYEAEDEGDDLIPEISRVSPRRPIGRRTRHRRRRVPLLPRLEQAGSSSSDENIFEAGNSDEDLSGEAKSRGNLTVDWPPWVIPCEECVVCWRVFRSGVRLGALPCGHGFHEACIRRWLDTGALDCPVCRWPAHAPHLRQQRQMIGQLLNAVQSTLNANSNRTTDCGRVSSFEQHTTF